VPAEIARADSLYESWCSSRETRGYGCPGKLDDYEQHLVLAAECAAGDPMSCNTAAFDYQRGVVSSITPRRALRVDIPQARERFAGLCREAHAGSCIQLALKL